MLTDAAIAHEAAFILYRLALAVEVLDLHAIIRDDNEDPSATSFPPVRDVELVDKEFEARKHHDKRMVTGLLDRFPSKVLAKIIEAVVRPGIAVPISPLVRLRHAIP